MGEPERPWRLLFVCTGNICRSPMAEGIARDYAQKRGRLVEVRSAGTMGLVGHAADSKAVAVCGELDVDLSAHRSQAIVSDLITWADWVLVMEFAHATHIREKFPEVGEKLVMLGSFAGLFELADPLGGWKFQFRRSRDEIRRCVESFVDRLPASIG